MYRAGIQRHGACILTRFSQVSTRAARAATPPPTPKISRRYFDRKPEKPSSALEKEKKKKTKNSFSRRSSSPLEKNKPLFSLASSTASAASKPNSSPRPAPSTSSRNKRAKEEDRPKPETHSQDTSPARPDTKLTPELPRSYKEKSLSDITEGDLWKERHASLRGDPKSFPGQPVFCLTAGLSNIKPPGHKVKLVRRYTLLKGPLRKEQESGPTNFRDNYRVNTMASYIYIASTPTADTGASLLLHFDHRRYLFGNLSEGTQRALTQRKFSLAKMETIFISGQTKWANTGGMIGMLLTIADVVEGSRREMQAQSDEKKKKARKQEAFERLEIHGAQNLNYSIATARGFVFRKGIPIRAMELYQDPRLANPGGSTPDWEDDAIQAWKIPISAGQPSSPSAYGKSRKRSHEVMTAEDDAAVATSQTTPATDVAADSATSEQQKITNREAVEAVVQEMFSSDWAMDQLYETKLSQVNLPATIFIRENGQIQKYKGPMPGDEGEVPDLDVLVRYPWPATKVRDLPDPERSTSAVCYVVKNRGRRGKFDPAAAKALGVAPVDFKHLTNGQTVKGKTGNDVTPDMVLGAPTKPVGFAIIDIASTSYIESFLGRPEWKNATLMDNVPAFFWILGRSVIDDARIQNFIRERPHIRHTIMAPDVSPNMVAMESYGLLHAKLRRIDPERFPPLQADNTVRDLSHIGSNVEAARVGMKAVLGAKIKAVNDDIVPFPTFKEASNIDGGALRMAAHAAAKVRKPAFLEEVQRTEQDIPNRDTEIIPLGTGSALPSKYRNVSATLIRVPQYGNYLLDCGENTLGQLRRAFPAEEVVKILRETRCVAISHIHADHQLGLASFVTAWAEATAALDHLPRLGIVGPLSIQNFLLEYNQMEWMDLRRLEFIRKHNIFPYGDGRLPEDSCTRLASVQLVPVRHCHHSYAVVLAWPSGLKIAYSGDCRPSDDLVEAGKGATLLIHESTFDDDKQGDALAKKHSTMSEALDVGYRMGARRVLLTHFSQRYAKIPLVEKRTTETGADQTVLMAFDQMRVKLGEFRQAQAFLPAIRQMLDAEEAPKADEAE
ncbi:metallo-beta-lactamase superfamily protein [Colletotrichum higginsianum]|uniref:ribonuclease Z n=2 Tax=Colletotrichum higginsianum (strain IMI 349063) TaxID=759273 RepID=H1V291_COLHI|nr:metallo-beta-lactamase superfamily protein [Colletotrichum higginsianum]